MRSLLRLLKKYSYILLFLLLEIVAFILLSKHNSYQQSRLLNTNREITGYIYSKFDGVREYLSLKKNNEILVHENASLRNQLEEMANQEIDSVGEPRIPAYSYNYARIVHSSVYKKYNYLTINSGRKHGVERDMAVIGEEGIVGIVLESSPNFATILPVINPDFRLSAKIKKNNYAGILLWDGASPRRALLNEIPYHVDVQPGDTVVTSGFSAIFPEGLHVGTISDFSLQEGNFYNISVDLGTNFNTLFYVNVIKNYYQEEQVQLEESIQE